MIQRGLQWLIFVIRYIILHGYFVTGISCSFTLHEGIRQRTCMTHRHRQQCGDGQREVGEGMGGVGQRGGTGDICNSVDNKNKVKK